MDPEESADFLCIVFYGTGLCIDNDQDGQQSEDDDETRGLATTLCRPCETAWRIEHTGLLALLPRDPTRITPR